MSDGIIVHLSAAERALLQKALFKELRACPEEGSSIECLFEKLNTGSSQLQVLIVPYKSPSCVD